MIISEPMGYMLFNERMLETYLHAKKWLKPGGCCVHRTQTSVYTHTHTQYTYTHTHTGKMYPTQGILYVAPFSDEALFLEQMGKTYFWYVWVCQLSSHDNILPSVYSKSPSLSLSLSAGSKSRFTVSTCQCYTLRRLQSTSGSPLWTHSTYVFSCLGQSDTPQTLPPHTRGSSTSRPISSQCNTITIIICCVLYIQD